MKNSFGELHKDILKEFWDFEKNTIDPFAITPCSKDFAWIKCTKTNYHESSYIRVDHVTEGSRCKYCQKKSCVHPKDSFAEYHKERLNDIWNYEKNMIDPVTIAPNSTKEIYIRCNKKDYHNYKIKAHEYTSKVKQDWSGCPYCSGRKVHPKDSFGEYFKDKIESIWDYNRNRVSPYHIRKSSTQIIYLKCPIHGSYKKNLKNAYRDKCRCPTCSLEQNQSRLQKKVKEYIASKGYTLKHEQDCSITLKNPETNRELLYDNEVVELKLVIEVHGEQHYKFFAHWHKTKEKFLKSKQRDKLKKEYALGNGYYFLEIPYTAENKYEYRKLIDNKIFEIQNIERG